jgi:phosphinothricin acetyltransferase
VAELIAAARAAGKTQIVAGIDGDNLASIAFHHALGFRQVARMPRIGFKFGRWLDLVLMQRSTDEYEARPAQRDGAAELRAAATRSRTAGTTSSANSGN